MPFRKFVRPASTIALRWCVPVVVLIGCARPQTPTIDDSPTQEKTSRASAREVFPELSTGPGSIEASGPTPRLTDVAAAAGIQFSYFNGMVPGRFFMPESTGGGAAWLDFDQDGLFDLYLTNGTWLQPGDADGAGRSAEQPVNQLFQNVGDGRFRQVSAPSRTDHPGYGQGCAVGDYNADGFPDMYLSNYGPNALLLNNGDGTYRDVTPSAAVGDEAWSTSAAWLDVDSDGDLDLYSTNYVDLTLANHRVCEYNGRPGYCGPGQFEPVQDRVYVSQGDGTFRDEADALGFDRSGKGLTVAAMDLDDDLRPELYVGNDLTPNFMYTRSVENGDGAASITYRETAASSGSAVSGDGVAEASMGIACADFDRDGRSDIFLTHYFQQKNTLYRNLGRLIFEDDSYRSRIAATSFLFLGFGTYPLDYDLDGAADLFVTNGHVLGPLQDPHEMQPQLLHNNGQGIFADVSVEAGSYFQRSFLGRGVAGGDYDNDGDSDLAVVHQNEPMALLRNDTETGHHFLGLSLATRDRATPVGGRVVVTSGDQQWVVPVVSGGSYLSSNDPRLLIGLGEHARADLVEIYWPSGKLDRFENLAVDQYWRVLEGAVPVRLPGT